jgi:hypothetical protein
MIKYLIPIIIIILIVGFYVYTEWKQIQRKERELDQSEQTWDDWWKDFKRCKTSQGFTWCRESVNQYSGHRFFINGEEIGYTRFHSGINEWKFHFLPDYDGAYYPVHLGARTKKEALEKVCEVFES